MFTDWLQFVAACAGVVLGGFFCVRYADRLGDMTGLGKVWAGAILLTLATSLPELVTGVSAVAFQGAPDLSAGGILGAAAVNLTTVALLGLRPRWRAMLIARPKGTGTLALMGLVIAGVAGVVIVLGRPSLGVPAWLLITLPPLILAGYAAASLRLFKMSGDDRRAAGSPGESGAVGGRGVAEAGEIRHRQTETPKQIRRLPLVRAVAGYLFFGGVVAASGFFTAGAAEGLAKSTGWSESFVGSQFLSIATTLPEITVGIVALRQGGVELALANQLGSVAFNMGVVLPSQSLASGSSPYLSRISGVHAGTALAICVMAGLAMWRGGAARRTGEGAAALWRRAPPAAVRGLAIVAIYVAVNVTNFLVGE